MPSFRLVVVTLALVATAVPAAAQEAAPETEQAEMSPGTHDVRVRDLEQRADQIGREIFRSEMALRMLTERYFGDSLGVAHATLVHENGMGPLFRLVGATYALDGRPIFRRLDTSGELGRLDPFDVYSGGLPLGEHVLSVRLDYVGEANLLFPYLEGYRFTVRSSHAFSAPSSGRLRLRVRTVERGGPTTPMHERPTVEFRERAEH